MKIRTDRKVMEAMAEREVPPALTSITHGPVGTVHRFFHAATAVLRTLAALVALLVCPASHGQDIAGRWITVDDHTGQQRSVVEITVSNGTASGRIVEVFDKHKADKTCDACTDDRKGKKVLGLEIIRNMVRDGDEWEDGTILDPDNGKVYACKLWVEDGKLRVRGYIAFFFRTQTWLRAEGR